MDALVNYGSDGENSNNSDDTKMFPAERADMSNRRASDANYDPVQMDMSEESNNNNSSDESGSERVNSPPPIGRIPNVTKTDSPINYPSPPSLRRLDHENNSSNTQEESKRSDRSERSRHSSDKTRRSSYEDRRRGSDYRDNKDSRKSRDDDRRSRDDDRRRERDKVSSSKDERDRSHRDDRRDRDRERDRDKDRGRDRRRDRDRDRDRRHSKEGRSKDRHRDERSSYHKERDRTRSRSRSRDKNQSNYRSLSYREEKNRNKLAQLEKLGIELKSPEGEAVAINSQEPNYYNPLATATQGKYAEQIQKRKLLWANKKQEEGTSAPTPAASANTWVGTTFTHDQDGKVTAKFKRLMGIKGDLPAANTEGSKPDILKKQEEMFTNMEQQYEVARATTHTQRGVGLGYASGAYQFPR
ncbi:arginine/serine-rich coiled-coil protein 2 isoform X2 [Belonocnema kinseyi]|uniref:arginine/serine-rich coiled-coil protein 2 isoform X2 n=1 Tax=Belonocnema kinseyi TaxID=2817044 RepID=UPI00143DB221|nr:arginine/serine-rich coiled-coil protein 2 isoform X2 [Belonocnema kinseyi]